MRDLWIDRVGQDVQLNVTLPILKPELHGNYYNRIRIYNGTYIHYNILANNTIQKYFLISYQFHKYFCSISLYIFYQTTMWFFLNKPFQCIFINTKKCFVPTKYRQLVNMLYGHPHYNCSSVWTDWISYILLCLIKLIYAWSDQGKNIFWFDIKWWLVWHKITNWLQERMWQQTIH